MWLCACARRVLSCRVMDLPRRCAPPLASVSLSPSHSEPAIAYWPGRIQPRVTPALASTLDIFPTFASLAGVPLPTDRNFDGADLSEVLFNGSDVHHSVLFHPDAINGNLTAIRSGQYKAFYSLFGYTACGVQNSSRPRTVDPPVIFDLEADPAESSPIQDPDPALVQQFSDLLNGMLRDIETSPRSKANYQRKLSDEGCCDLSAPSCACNRNPTPPPPPSTSLSSASAVPPDMTSLLGM